MLIEAVDGPVFLLGHSFGGLLALEGAGRCRVDSVAKLLVCGSARGQIVSDAYGIAGHGRSTADG